MHASAFAYRLRELRGAARLTQRELAEKAGVALRTVSSLEQALYEPVWSTVLALSKALAVEVQAFVVEDGQPGLASASVPPKAGRGRPPKLNVPEPRTPRRKGRGEPSRGA
jgi:putative transcriptional regulator